VAQTNENNTEMTDWDKSLISKARRTRFKDYQLAYDLVELADSDEAKYTLNEIANVLFGIHQNTGYSG